MMKMYDEREAAQFLNCSVACLRRRRLENQPPKFTRIGRLVRYREDWLASFVEANAVLPRREERTGECDDR